MKAATAAAPASTPAPAKETLFTLTEDLRALDELLTESGGELTPEVELWIQEYSTKLKGKVDGIAWFIKTCEARAVAFKAHAKQIREQADDLAAKGKTEENKIVRLKEYVRLCLDLMGEKKVQGEVYSIGIEANGGAAPATIVAEPFASHPEKLPAELRILPPMRWEPNMEQITKLAAAAGGSLVVKGEGKEPDVTIATIPPRGTHVRVR